MGRKEREVLQKMAEITKEGFLLKKQLIEEAKKGKQEKQVREDAMEDWQILSHTVSDFC